MRSIRFHQVVRHFWGANRRRALMGLCALLLILISAIALFHLSPYRADNSQLQYFRATVVMVQPAKTYNGSELNIAIRLLDGPARGRTVQISWPDNLGDAAAKRLPVGSQVLVTKSAGDAVYSAYGRWYMPGLLTIIVSLVVLVIVVGAWRGVTSVVGLALSIGIISVYVIPKIIAGENAFVVCIEAAIAICLVSVYIAHGISRRTTIALLGSLVSLGVVIGLTCLASYVSGTSEVIGEDTATLLSAVHPINLSGLLTGGIIIASLGALFDITTGQAATIDELHKTDCHLTTSQLFVRGMSVGREHLAALVNTLALVYVGVALPTIVLNQVIYNQPNSFSHIPLLIQLNTEPIAEEVVRTAVTSIGMLLALPITTWLAAMLLPRWKSGLPQIIKDWLQQL